MSGMPRSSPMPQIPFITPMHRKLKKKMEFSQSHPFYYGPMPENIKLTKKDLTQTERAKTKYYKKAGYGYLLGLPPETPKTQQSQAPKTRRLLGRGRLGTILTGPLGLPDIGEIAKQKLGD